MDGSAMTVPETLDQEHLRRAYAAAEDSGDPVTRAGAVLIGSDGVFLAAGADGFPREYGDRRGNLLRNGRRGAKNSS